MGTVLIVMIIAALVGGVFWNRRNAAAAMEGVRFRVAASPEVVVQSVRAGYCGGAGAAVRSGLSGIRVTPAAATSFRVQSRFGDVGSLEVVADGSGSVVQAQVVELYLGSPRSAQFHRGIMGLSSLIVHRLFTLLGIAPERLASGVSSAASRAGSPVPCSDRRTPDRRAAA